MPTLFLPRLFATTGVVRLSGLRSQTAEGSLEGRVRHAATGQSLGNARVLVPGSPLVAYSDEVGAFRLAHVPVSPVTREVFFYRARCPANPARPRRRSDARAGHRSHQRRALRSAVGNREARRLRCLQHVTADYDWENGNSVASVSVRGFSRPPRTDGQRHDPGKREAKPKTKMLERRVLGNRAVQWVRPNTVCRKLHPKPQPQRPAPSGSLQTHG